MKADGDEVGGGFGLYPPGRQSVRGKQRELGYS